MIWIEILSRQREIAARFRIAGPEARIGRGYDNDVIVDDPYVAASHLRVFRDEAGQLVAEDLGSVNGIYLDGSKSRSARIVVNGKDTIRIGQTSLRVRDTTHEVERERVAPADRRFVPALLAVALHCGRAGILRAQGMADADQRAAGVELCHAHARDRHDDTGMDRKLGAGVPHLLRPHALSVQSAHCARLRGCAPASMSSWKRSSPLRGPCRRSALTNMW